jgi:hypothetical protein
MKAQQTPVPALMPVATGMASVNSLLSGNGPHHRSMTSPGFWNDLPMEEERIPRPPMKPHYGRKEQVFNTLSWIDLGELALFLGILYTTIGCTHIMIMFLNWSR